MQRIVTALVLGFIVAGLLLYAPPVWAGIVLGAFWLVGVWEWTRFARLGAVAAAVYILGFAGLMMLAAPYVSGEGVLLALLVLAAIWWLLALFGVVSYPRSFGSALTVVAGYSILLPAWLILVNLHAVDPAGPQLILVLLCIVWGADVGAYVVGRFFGRHKLAPKVSPGKTWEGVAGGLVTAGVVGAIAGFVIELPAAPLVATAVAAGAGSVLGDLTVSMFKRNCGMKDSSRLLPGHGGVLDRIDSLTSAVAVFAAGIVLSGLIQ